VSNKKSIIHVTLSSRPDLLALLENHPDKFPFLLETTALATKSDNKGFDILFALPQQQLVKDSENKIKLNHQLCETSSFLTELDKIWRQEKIESTLEDEIALPFCGGWFLYLGYELAAEIEPTIQFKKTNQDVPVAFAIRTPAAIIYDHTQEQTHIVIETEFADELESIKQNIAAIKQGSMSDEAILTEALKEENPDIYLHSVRRILEYIREGDVFQVNLSRQWEAQLKPNVTDVNVYRHLRNTNPAPYSAIIKHNNFSVVSSSPERLFCTDGERIETRPIAGTRPRGETARKDSDLQKELITNYKERAEHIMLIDLERNDLGRICKPGTIQVDEFMAMESYAHVHHIVSNVSGQLSTGMTPGKIIRAVFPGGTITGCPKVRCMEIISELERQPRGAYTGSIGYLNHSGNMDFNILIRSLTIQNQKTIFRAGAGIVADSVPEREVDETRAKAKGIIKALQD
jgi:anthranilate synthase component 1